MKCSASQTTCSVNSTPQPTQELSAAEDEKLHKVATQFEAILVSIVMRPMSKAMGPMGDLLNQEMSLKLAAGMSDPLYEQLRAQIG